MANLTTLIAMLSGTDDTASGADNLRDGYMERDAEGVAVAIVGGAGPTQPWSNWGLRIPRLAARTAALPGGALVP